MPMLIDDPASPVNVAFQMASNRSYVGFESHEHAAAHIECLAERARVLGENIPPAAPSLLYFDIDVKVAACLDHGVEPPSREAVLEAGATRIIELVQAAYGVQLTTEDLLVATACSKTKLSFHILVFRMLPDCDARADFRLFLKRQDLSLLDIPADCIDPCVYSRGNQIFRGAYCLKAHKDLTKPLPIPLTPVVDADLSAELRARMRFMPWPVNVLDRILASMVTWKVEQRCADFPALTLLEPPTAHVPRAPRPVQHVVDRVDGSVDPRVPHALAILRKIDTTSVVRHVVMSDRGLEIYMQTRAQRTCPHGQAHEHNNYYLIVEDSSDRVIYSCVFNRGGTNCGTTRDQWETCIGRLEVSWKVHRDIYNFSRPGNPAFPAVRPLDLVPLSMLVECSGLGTGKTWRVVDHIATSMHSSQRVVFLSHRVLLLQRINELIELRRSPSMPQITLETINSCWKHGAQCDLLCIDEIVEVAKVIPFLPRARVVWDKLVAMLGWSKHVVLMSAQADAAEKEFLDLLCPSKAQYWRGNAVHRGAERAFRVVYHEDMDDIYREFLAAVKRGSVVAPFAEVKILKRFAERLREDVPDITMAEIYGDNPEKEQLVAELYAGVQFHVVLYSSSIDCGHDFYFPDSAANMLFAVIDQRSIDASTLCQLLMRFKCIVEKTADIHCAPRMRDWAGYPGHVVQKVSKPPSGCRVIQVPSLKALQAWLPRVVAAEIPGEFVAMSPGGMHHVRLRQPCARWELARVEYELARPQRVNHAAYAAAAPGEEDDAERPIENTEAVDVLELMRAAEKVDVSALCTDDSARGLARWTARMLRDRLNLGLDLVANFVRYSKLQGSDVEVLHYNAGKRVLRFEDGPPANEQVADDGASAGWTTMEDPYRFGLAVTCLANQDLFAKREVFEQARRRLINRHGKELDSTLMAYTTARMLLGKPGVEPMISLPDATVAAFATVDWRDVNPDATTLPVITDAQRRAISAVAPPQEVLALFDSDEQKNFIHRCVVQLRGGALVVPKAHSTDDLERARLLTSALRCVLMAKLLAALGFMGPFDYETVVALPEGGDWEVRARDHVEALRRLGTGHGVNDTKIKVATLKGLRIAVSTALRRNLSIRLVPAKTTSCPGKKRAKRCKHNYRLEAIATLYPTPDVGDICEMLRCYDTFHVDYGVFGRCGLASLALEV